MKILTTSWKLVSALSFLVVLGLGTGSAIAGEKSSGPKATSGVPGTTLGSEIPCLYRRCGDGI